MLTSLSLFVVFKVLKRSDWPALVLAPALAVLTAAPLFGDIISSGSQVIFTGTNAAGLSARATFTVDHDDSDVLWLLLENTSAKPTMEPSELLTSVYFNVLSKTTTGSPAPLSYQSATGQVYLTDKNKVDDPVTYVPPPPKNGAITTPKIPTPSNLKAVNRGDNTWLFRDDMSLEASQPPLAFGVGTVGNNSLKPSNFNGSITGGFDFGIYVGDVTTQSLDDTLLVRNAADFAFAGFKGFTLSQVSPHVVFGFGTNPEIIITVPEPATLWLAGGGLLAILAMRRGQRSLLAAGIASVAAISLLFSLP
jgi:hypothetical protein